MARKTIKPENDQAERKAANRDPITDEPGAHPLATGVGAVIGGAVAGAAIGAAGAGPIGMGLGAAAGAAVGGLAGHEMGEQINPTVEFEFWREHFHERPYVADEDVFDDYAPAYRFGWESYCRYGSSTIGEPVRFEDVEQQLHLEWDNSPHAPALMWEDARPAIRDAWDRTQDAFERTGQKPCAPQRTSIDVG